MVRSVEENAAVQSLSAVKTALSLGGSTLRGAVGATFVYNPRFTTYEQKPTRNDAPSNAVRFVLYASDGDGIVVPLVEIGHLDVTPDPVAGDTALAVRGAVGASSLEYAAHGFDRAHPLVDFEIDSARLNAAGVVSTGSEAATVESSKTLQATHRSDSFERHEYVVQIPDQGSIQLVFSRDVWRDYSDWDTEGSTRITFPSPNAGTSDSTVIETDWSHARCHGGLGTIRWNGDVAVERVPGSFIVFGDTLSSDVLTDFWGSFGNTCNEFTRRFISPILGSTSPASFAFRVAATAVGDLEVTTLTTGTNPDPDGYTVTVDESESTVRWQSLGASETILLSNIPAGSHEVELVDVAPNCAASGNNPRTIDISEGESSSISFEVNCT
jgi:hypothetical protein